MLKLIIFKTDTLKINLIKATVSLLVTSFSLASLILANLAEAEALSSTVVTHEYLTVEENIALMDTDKNGFADVMEVRAYLEKMHGAGYEKERLDFLVSTAKGKSCSTPFAKALY